MNTKAKTAREWIDKLNGEFQSDLTTVNEPDIESIQRDAREAALREAADMLQTHMDACRKVTDSTNTYTWSALNSAKVFVLSLIDKEAKK